MLKQFTFLALIGAAIGCSGGSAKPPAPLTEEQKKAIKEEDRSVQDAERGVGRKKK
jgi:hypothetical protein